MTDNKINWDWLAGFFEGEGTLDIFVRPRETTPSGLIFSCTVKMNQTDDGYLMVLYEKIGFLLSENNINYSISKITKPKKQNRKPSATITINGKHECLKLLQEMLPHMHIYNKRKQAEAMIRGIEYMNTYQHVNYDGIMHLMDIVEEIRSYRTDRGSRKYTKKYIKQYLKDNPPRPRKMNYTPPMPHTLDEEITRLYDEGISMREIGRRLGYSAPAIRNRCISLGIHISERGNWKINPDDYKKILKLYDDGVNVNDICEEYNVSDTTIRRVLRRNKKIKGWS